MLTSRRNYWLFLLPGLLGVTVFYLAPFLGGGYYAMMSDTVPYRFAGVKNFIETWQNSGFRLGLTNTLLFSVIVAPLTVFIAFIFACVLWQTRAWVPRLLVLLPYVIPTVCIVYVWNMLFKDHGVVNELTGALFGFRASYFVGGMARVPVIALLVFRNVGFCAILFYSSLSILPDDYYQFATLEGAPFITRHLKITLPLMFPAILFVMMLTWSMSFKVFKEIYALSGNYPDRSVYTLQHYLNNQFAGFNYASLTSAAYIFAFIIFILFSLLFYGEARSRKGLY
jgi:multiple sugar transport system permease protein